MRFIHGAQQGRNFLCKTCVTKANQSGRAVINGHQNWCWEGWWAFWKILLDLGKKHNVFRYAFFLKHLLDKSHPHKWSFFFGNPKMGIHAWYLCVTFHFEGWRAFLIEFICLWYMLLVESSASPEKFHFGVFLRSLRYGESNNPLDLFPSFMVMEK